VAEEAAAAKEKIKELTTQCKETLKQIPITLKAEHAVIVESLKADMRELIKGGATKVPCPSFASRPHSTHL
jgi:hypothetical protein